LAHDCSLWGGPEERFACENVFALPIVSVSSLTGADALEQARASFDEAVARGCRQDTGFDEPPPRAVCDTGKCSFLPREPACGAAPVDDAGP
jgi:hypothetical protein